MGVLNHGTEGPISTVEQDNVEKSEGEKWLQDNGFTAQGSDRRKAGRVAIEWAISHRSIAVVHLLLKEAGVNLSRKFKNGDAPLHAAVRIGDIEIMRALVEDDEEIMNEKNDEGWTPLHIAGQSTQIEPLKQLLDLGADVTAPSAAEGCRGFTVFHCVASEGTYEMAKLLLERGVDVTAMDSYKIRPLARLADKNYGYSKPYRKRDSWDEALAVLLIDNGADVNAQDFWGATALHRAAAQGNATMIKTLIKCGADVTIEDGSGKTPLGWAEYHPEVHGLLSFPVSNDWEIL
jgi:ankyrin repeat protein